MDRTGYVILYLGTLCMHHLAEKLNLLRSAVGLHQEADEREGENAQFLMRSTLLDY